MLNEILGNAVIVPDSADAWTDTGTYEKNAWIYHAATDRNWTARRATHPGEEPGKSEAWLPGPGGVGGLGTSAESVFLSRDTASMETDYFTWVNNSNGTGTLTVRRNILARIWCQGGGGGGGGGGHTRMNCGGGGNSGETVIKVLRLEKSTVIPVSIGSAGSKGSYASAENYVTKPGGTGGTTSLGSMIAARGGVGGSGWQGTGGDQSVNVNQSGAVGAAYMNNGPVLFQAGRPAHLTVQALDIHGTGGAGGSSPFGRGGGYSKTVTSATGANANGNPATGYGAGGGGGAGSLAWGFDGGNGTAGCIYIERIS